VVGLPLALTVALLEGAGFQGGRDAR
jgi:hypothetical protein